MTDFDFERSPNDPPMADHEVARYALSGICDNGNGLWTIGANAARGLMAIARAGEAREARAWEVMCAEQKLARLEFWLAMRARLASLAGASADRDRLMRFVKHRIAKCIA